MWQEKKKLQDETEALSDRLQDEMESRRKLADKLSHERHLNQKEKESTQEVGLVCSVDTVSVKWHHSREYISPLFHLTADRRPA